MKLYTTVLFLIISIPVIAQEGTANLSLRKNEIKIEPIGIVTGNALHLTYERYINTSFSFGATARIRTSRIEFEGSSDAKNKHHFIVFGRLYAFKTNFYMEAFTGIATSERKFTRKIIDNEGFLVYTKAIKTHNNAAIGFSLGQKIIFTNRITLDITLGIGDTPFNSALPDIFFRGGINVGYKF